jgi:hypothetical protein
MIDAGLAPVLRAASTYSRLRALVVTLSATCTDTQPLRIGMPKRRRTLLSFELLPRFHYRWKYLSDRVRQASKLDDLYLESEYMSFTWPGKTKSPTRKSWAK